MSSIITPFTDTFEALAEVLDKCATVTGLWSARAQSSVVGAPQSLDFVNFQVKTKILLRLIASDYAKPSALFMHLAS
jgi:hypothetical protein